MATTAATAPVGSPTGGDGLVMSTDSESTTSPRSCIPWASGFKATSMRANSNAAICGRCLVPVPDPGVACVLRMQRDYDAPRSARILRPRRERRLRPELVGHHAARADDDPAQADASAEANTRRADPANHASAYSASKSSSRLSLASDSIGAATLQFATTT